MESKWITNDLVSTCPTLLRNGNASIYVGTTSGKLFFIHLYVSIEAGEEEAEIQGEGTDSVTAEQEPKEDKTSVSQKQWPESDLEMLKGTLSSYVNKQPFHIYYMTVSGHSLYTFDKNAMSKKHKDKVENLGYSEPVKAYLACQVELDEALEYLVGQLERLHMEDDTVIVISADHFPYGLDQDSGAFTYLQELYGHKIQDNLDRDHNRLIIWSGCLEKERPIVVDDPVSSLDVLPTLCNLFGVRFDSRLLPGRDIFSDAMPLVFNGGYDWKTDKGTFIASRGKFIPKNSGEEVDAEYVEKVKAIVKNKITYCKGVLSQDYFRHVFAEEISEEK